MTEPLIQDTPRSIRHRSATATKTPLAAAAAWALITSAGRSPAGQLGAGQFAAGQFTGAAIRSAPLSEGKRTHSGNSRS